MSSDNDETKVQTTKTKNSSNKASRKKEQIVDLTKFGDDPNPDDMNSPEKRKFGEVLMGKNIEVLSRVSQALNQVK